MLRIAVYVAYGVGFVAAAVATYDCIRMLVATILARRNLARAVAATSPDKQARLRESLNVGDVAGAVALISEHLGELPPRERAQAIDSLTQRSESGRRMYAVHVAMAAGLRP